jgi:hypothetical protein
MTERVFGLKSGALPRSSVTLQRRGRDVSASRAVPSIVHEVLASPGEPLDGNVRTFLEPRLAREFAGARARGPSHLSTAYGIGPEGSEHERQAEEIASRAASDQNLDDPRRGGFDLSGVRVHTGERADAAAHAVSAQKLSRSDRT